MRRSILLPFLLTAAVFAQGIVAQGVGDAAPEFTLVDRSGEPVRLSDFQGTPLVLNIWATWCPPCREELPLFQEAHDTLSETEEAVAFLLLNAGEGAEKAEAYLDEVGVTLPAALDATREERAAFEGGLDETTDVLRRYRARGMPTTFFIDTSGTIQFVRQGLLSAADLADDLATIGVDWQP